jgi:predicted nucleotidyltransferase
MPWKLYPMPNLFLNSAKPRFADKREILSIARQIAFRIARAHPEVLKIILFGSFARGDYGVRSDLDLLVVLTHSDRPAQERLTDFLSHAQTYPTDMLLLTQAELESRLAEDDPFLKRAVSDGIQLYPVTMEAEVRR